MPDVNEDMLRVAKLLAETLDKNCEDTEEGLLVAHASLLLLLDTMRREEALDWKWLKMYMDRPDRDTPIDPPYTFGSVH